MSEKEVKVVKRYDIVPTDLIAGASPWEALVTFDGEYVLASDYDALAAENARLREVLVRVQTALNQTSPVLWKSLKAAVNAALSQASPDGSQDSGSPKP